METNKKLFEEKENEKLFRYFKIGRQNGGKKSDKMKDVIDKMEFLEFNVGEVRPKLVQNLFFKRFEGMKRNKY